MWTRPALAGGILLAWALALFALALTACGGPAPPPTPLPTPPPPPPAMQQTLGFTTLAVRPISADASRIVLTTSVSLTKPPAACYRSFSLQHVTLSVGGTALAEMPEYRWPVGGQLREFLPAFEDRPERLLMFDMASLPAKPSADVHLQVSLNLCQAPNDHHPPTAGPFTFSFDMPVDPLRRVAVVQQTLLGYTGAFTLDRVIATRYETRLDLRYGMPGPPPKYPGTIMLPVRGAQTLQAGDHTLSFDISDAEHILGTRAGDSFTLSFLASTLDWPSTWTLNLGADPSDSRGGGPWVFRFPMGAVGAPPLVLTPVVLPPLPTPTRVPFVSPIPTAFRQVPPVPIPSGVSRLPTPVRSTGPPPGPRLAATAVPPGASPPK